MCGGHYDVGGNEEGKKVLSVCRWQTRSRYELYESFLASSVDSFCFFNTPRSKASRWLADCAKSGGGGVSPPASEFASPSRVHSSLLLWGSELCWFLGDVQLVLRS